MCIVYRRAPGSILGDVTWEKFRFIILFLSLAFFLSPSLSLTLSEISSTSSCLQKGEVEEGEESKLVVATSPIHLDPCTELKQTSV